MDHHDIEDQQLVDRYLLGRLPPEQAAAFEQHYLGCSECLDQLELAEKLQLGFKAAAVQTAVARAGLLATLLRALRSPQGAALLAALLVAVVAPIGWLGSRLDQRDGELEQLRATLAAQLSSEQSLSRELVELREGHHELETRLARVFAPQENPLVLALGAERSSAGAASAELHLPAKPGWIFVALELDTVDQPSYRAELLGPEETALWTSGPLVPDPMANLNLGLHSSWLPAGDYSVRVHGPSAERSPAIVSGSSPRRRRVSDKIGT